MKEKKTVSFKAAAIIQFLSKYASIAIQLAFTVILARLLTPEDYGSVAIVTVFTSFFALFADMGISTAIVQFRELKLKDYEKLFGLSVIMTICLATVFGFAAFPIALFYKDSSIQYLLYAAIPSIIFNTLNMVPNGIMLKEKQFMSIGIRLVTATLIAGGLAILFAKLGFGAYALIWQINIQAFIVFLWNIVKSPIRKMDLHFVDAIRPIFSYSAFQFGFSFVNYFSRNLDNMMIGKYFSPTSLGYYDKAYKLTTYPLSSFAGIIGSIVQPFMAEHQKDTKVIFNFWLKISKFISLIGAYICAILAANSSAIVLIFYGDQWRKAAPLFVFLSISLFAQMLGSPTGAFFQSLGKTNLMFISGIINTVIMIAMLFVGLSFHNLTIVAACVAGAFFLQLIPLFYILICKGFHEKFRVIFRFVPEFFLTIVAIFICRLINALLINKSIFLAFGINICFITMLFILGYYLTRQIHYITDVLPKYRE